MEILEELLEVVAVAAALADRNTRPTIANDAVAEHLSLESFTRKRLWALRYHRGDLVSNIVECLGGRHVLGFHDSMQPESS
jgi:hypothetical protein